MQEVRVSDNSQDSVDTSPTSATVGKSSRRSFTREYKRTILKELDAAKHGEKGKILRREGLYTQTVEKWRKEETGEVQPVKRGPQERPNGELRQQLAKKDRAIQRLEKKLAQAEKIIELQKKLSELLGLELNTEE
jgi:transposase-like protein